MILRLFNENYGCLHYDILEKYFKKPKTIYISTSLY